MPLAGGKVWIKCSVSTLTHCCHLLSHSAHLLRSNSTKKGYRVQLSSSPAVSCPVLEDHWGLKAQQSVQGKLPVRSNARTQQGKTATTCTCSRTTRCPAGRSLPCADITELMFQSNCSSHKYLTWQRCVSAQGYEAEIWQTRCSQRSRVSECKQDLLVREVHRRPLAAEMSTPTLMSIPSLAWRSQHWEVPRRPSPAWAWACPY